MSQQPYLEAGNGIRYDIPAEASNPINVGRVGAPGQSDGGVGIPQGEHTKYVSRKHASLWRLDDGRWEASDAGSASGLWVNGVKAVPETRYPLADGSKIRLGNYELSFRIPDPAAAEAVGTGTSGGHDGGTMVLRDFQPSSAPAAPAGVEIGEKAFFDSRAGGQAVEMEIPLRPGIRQWTIGRAIKSEGADPYTDHASVPNLPEFNSVSRRHVMLSVGQDGKWSIKNLSSQGAKLNGENLSGDAATPIRPGDKLVMGSRVFIFREGTIRPQYNDEEFNAVGLIVPEDHGPQSDNPDLVDTREIPVGSIHRVEREIEELPAWGKLIENKLMSPRNFDLRKRKTKIGSHPINSDIRLEDVGIDDLHATIEWHGKDCKIHSKSQESPVRVNHATYRVSPPIQTGAVLTIGNQEFHIDITGEPPMATGTVVMGRVRRLVIIGMAMMMLICMGTVLLAGRATPPPRIAQAWEFPKSDAVVREVLQNRGLSGLRVLQDMKAEPKRLTPEQVQIVDKLERIAEMDRKVNRSPERDFRAAVAEIDKTISQDKDIFQMAGLPATEAEKGWFGELQQQFAKRRLEAYSSEWAVMLQALRDNNLPNARSILVSLTNTTQELRDQAATAIERWDQIDRAVRSRSQSELLDNYITSIRNSRGAAYLAEQRGQFGELVKMLEQIEKDPSETNDALIQSNQWVKHKATLTMLDNTIKALEAYQKGSLEEFDTAYEALAKENHTPLLNTMQVNLQNWTKWQSDFQSAGGGAASQPALIARLSELRLQFSESLDSNSAILQTIGTRIASLSGSRASQASALRGQAAQLPEGFDRINRLLDAFRFDSNTRAADEIDQAVAKMAGIAQSSGTVARDAANFTKIKDRINGYIADGTMGGTMTAPRQIDNLLRQAGQ